VTGAGGFIGHHLVKRLKKDGHWVRGVDLKRPEYEASHADEFVIGDLRNWNICLEVSKGIDEVYNLAADMGGIGYITAHLASIAHNNTLININMLEACYQNFVKKFLFSSSACVYAQNKQQQADVAPLKEEDAYPADPEPGYGWEKLFAEQMCKYYGRDYGLNVRIVRFHNVYGPLGTYSGGKEKSPAAICRKVAYAINNGNIEIWGDGKQTRSYMYIDDCVEGLIRLMASNYQEPLNLGTDELISIDDLTDKVCAIANKTLVKKHDLTKPQGVRGRNSDNNKLREVLGWEPNTTLTQGLKNTYEWIRQQVLKEMGQDDWNESPVAGQLKTIIHRLNDKSVIFEVGGYRGWWAAQMAEVYDPFLYIFEPVEEFYNAIIERFKSNPKVRVFNFGLANITDSVKFVKDADKSSTHRNGSVYESVELRDIVGFLAEHNIDKVDLININIEGGEYPLLNHILDSGVTCFGEIQVQFHDFVPNADSLRDEIRTKLSKDYSETYSYPFIWENWKRK
jgi:FkbM family methyltransferase